MFFSYRGDDSCGNAVITGNDVEVGKIWLVAVTSFVEACYVDICMLLWSCTSCSLLLMELALNCIILRCS